MRAKLTQAFVRDLAAGSGDVGDTTLPGFVLRVRPSGAKTWVFRYRVDGGPQRRLKIGVFPSVSAEQARRQAMIAAADVAKGIDVIANKRAEVASAKRLRAGTLKLFMDDQYELWARAHLHTHSFQLKRIRSDFKHWLDRPIASLDLAAVEKWRAVRLETGNQPVTINRNLQRLYALISKAVEWKVVDSHPLLGLRPLKCDKTGRVRYLDEGEEQRLRKALLAREDMMRGERETYNGWRIARQKPALERRTEEYLDHLHPMVLLALNTGLRRGELFNLRWQDVNLETKWLVVVGKTSKNKQTRRVPLNLESLSILSTWRRCDRPKNESPYVFPGVDQKPLTTINTAWRKLRKLAGLRSFNFHDLRHHFASRLVQSGVDLNQVRELLGHGDLKMVLRYAHLAPAGLAAAVERISRNQTDVVQSVGAGYAALPSNDMATIV